MYTCGFDDYTFRLLNTLKSGILHWRCAIKPCKCISLKTGSECTEQSLCQPGYTKWKHKHKRKIFLVFCRKSKLQHNAKLRRIAYHTPTNRVEKENLVS